MTDPLSTIRQALGGILAVTENNNELSCEQRVREAHRIAYDALVACDALEAERLTPKEARFVLAFGLDPLVQSDNIAPLRAKLERIAGD